MSELIKVYYDTRSILFPALQDVVLGDIHRAFNRILQKVAITLETDIAPENGWLEYDPFLLGLPGACEVLGSVVTPWLLQDLRSQVNDKKSASVSGCLAV